MANNLPVQPHTIKVFLTETNIVIRNNRRNIVLVLVRFTLICAYTSILLQFQVKWKRNSIFVYSTISRQLKVSYISIEFTLNSIFSLPKVKLFEFQQTSVMKIQ